MTTPEGTDKIRERDIITIFPKIYGVSGQRILDARDLYISLSLSHFQEWFGEKHSQSEDRILAETG